MPWELGFSLRTGSSGRAASPARRHFPSPAKECLGYPGKPLTNTFRTNSMLRDHWKPASDAESRCIEISPFHSRDGTGPSYTTKRQRGVFLEDYQDLRGQRRTCITTHYSPGQV